MSDAEKLFTEVFMALTQRSVDAAAFRRLAELGLPLATSQLMSENSRLARSIQEDPGFDEFFIDRHKAVEYLGGPEAITESLTSTQIKKFKRAIDAATLIFVHSALDAAATDLCRVTALIAPDDWEQFVEDQKVALSLVRTAQYDELRRTKIEAHLKVLAQASLLKRVDRLLAVCHPPADFSPVLNYTYDRDELARLDRLRHDVVHAPGELPPIADVGEAKGFLDHTGMFLLGLVNHRYKVKMDPLHALTFRAAFSVP